MIFYQNCWIIHLRSYLGSARAHPYFTIFKNLLVTNHKAEGVHILFEALLGDPLPKLLKLFPLGHIWALPGHTLFYIETKKETFNKSFSDKP